VLGSPSRLRAKSQSDGGSRHSSPFLAISGCVTIQVRTRPWTKHQGAAPVLSGEGAEIALVFSPDAEPRTPLKTGKKLVACVQRAAVHETPPILLIGRGQLYELLFPGREPSAISITDETLPCLVAEPDTHRRIEELGLRYLILVGGQPYKADWEIMDVQTLSASYDEWASFYASVFDLATGARIATAQSYAEGGVFGMAGFAGGVDSQASACRGLGDEIVRWALGR
jgi:hypothetical protein